MIAAQSPTQASVFLDSNVLVGLFQFWDACRAAGSQLGDVHEWGDLKEALTNAGIETPALNRDDAAYVRTGLTSFQSLRQGVGQFHFFSSRVCWAELQHVILEARGLEQLILQGVPHSLRIKRPQVMYRAALDADGYAQLANDIDTFREDLWFSYELDILDAENGTTGMAAPTAEIWEIAQSLWSHVLMEVIDAYVYAAAIRVSADIFVTADGPLVAALEYLSSPSDEWAPLVASLKDTLGFPSDVPLPLPVRPNQFRPADGGQ